MPGAVHSPTAGRLNQQIASVAVRGHKRFLGRGPTKAQAFFRRNVIVVIMEDTLTEAERRLAAAGEREAVLQMRRRCQQMMRPELVDAIEDLTGCRVEASMSGSHIEPDLAAELFVLDRPVPVEPELAEGES
jgi:uncharacterized protein YbcI